MRISERAEVIAERLTGSDRVPLKLIGIKGRGIGSTFRQMVPSGK
jgi:hypothetical protein